VKSIQLVVGKIAEAVESGKQKAGKAEKNDSEKKADKQ
jgi:hypothetical protein